MYAEYGDIPDSNHTSTLIANQKLTVRQKLSAFIDRRKAAVQNINAVSFFNPAFQMSEGEFVGGNETYY